MEKMTVKTMDRRSFVALAAVAGASVITGGMLVGCAGEEPRAAEEPETQAEPAVPATEPVPEAAPEPATVSKTLVAVFSWSGHTLAAAERVHELVGGDFFRIEPAEPYTTDYDALLDVARQEQGEGRLPPLAATVEGWDEYDTVYLGFPTWWSHLPPAVATFVTQHDLTGKTVHPFNTSGGSGLAGTLSDIQAICPDVQFTDGLSLDGDTVASSLDRVDAWVGGLGAR